MNNNTTKTGLVVDQLGTRADSWSTNIKNRINDVRKQARDRKYVGINTEVERRISEAFLRGNPNFTYKPTRTAAIKEASQVLFLTTNYNDINREVRFCLHNENRVPVSIFHPFENPDMVTPKSIREWEEIVNKKQVEFRRRMNLANYANNMEELSVDINNVLDVELTWVGAKPFTLRQLLERNFRNNFGEFMEYIQARIENFKDGVQYDTEQSKSYVENPRSSFYKREGAYSIIKNREKDTYTLLGDIVTYNEEEQVWRNYEVMPADIIREFLSLSYYQAVGIKPLQRVVIGEEGDYEKFHQQYVKDTQVSLTPLYVETEHVDDLYYPQDDTNSEEYDIIYNKIGLETIQKLGYEEALKAIRYNLRNK